MVIGTIETLESLLDGFWKSHKVDVDLEEFEKRRHLASIYSRLVIISFLTSSIASYLESATLSSISKDLSSLSRRIPFSQAQKEETSSSNEDHSPNVSSGNKNEKNGSGGGNPGVAFWVPSSSEDFSRFYRYLGSYFSRFQDYLESLEMEASSGKLSVVPKDSKRFYESLDRSLDYTSFAKKAISNASPEDLPKVSSIVRRSTKILRLIRDGLFDYKGLVYDLYRSDFMGVDEGGLVKEEGS